MNELIGESIMVVYKNLDAAWKANSNIFEAGKTIHNMEITKKIKSSKLVTTCVSASRLFDSSGKYTEGGLFHQVPAMR